MYILKSDKVLFVDVDNTLVTWSGHEFTANVKYITLIKQFHARGQPVIVWSAGGHSWAERIVKEFGLEPYVTAIMSKPAWWADDQQAAEFMPESTRIFFKD